MTGGADSILASVLGLDASSVAPESAPIDNPIPEQPSLLDLLLKSLSPQDKVSRRATYNRIETLRKDDSAQVIENDQGLITVVSPGHEELALLDLDTVA